MEQSNQRTYKLASVGEYVTFPDVEKHVLTVWGFDFMLSCFHQNFWRLKKEELLQFAKCSTFRCSLRSLQNQNLRQSFSDGNISFVINQSNKSKPIEQLSLNWSIYYLFSSRRLFIGSKDWIFHHKLLLKFPNKTFLLYNCCFYCLWVFFHNNCIRFW